MKLLIIKIAISLTIFLSANGCASRAISFSPDFIFHEIDGEIKACLTMEKVKELAEKLKNKESFF